MLYSAKNDKDKRTSLFVLSIGKEDKKFYNIYARAQSYKTFLQP